MLEGYTPAMTFGKEVAAMMRDATRGDEDAAWRFCASGRVTARR